MIIGIDHGYYAIKTRNCSFLAGITSLGHHEPYTRQNVLTFGGCFFVCGSGRQPIQRDKTANGNYRTDPITGEISYHSGTDIAVPEGTPILAAAAGTVTIANATDSWGGSYGYYVKIDHSGGLTTLYAHCSSICVTAGQQVDAGQVIAYVGHTGRATGSHLHWEIRQNGTGITSGA